MFRRRELKTRVFPRAFEGVGGQVLRREAQHHKLDSLPKPLNRKQHMHSKKPASKWHYLAVNAAYVVLVVVLIYIGVIGHEYHLDTP